MDMQAVIQKLENEWEKPTGFLGGLREGVFDPEGLNRLVDILQSVDLEGIAQLDRRFVALTWYIPLFMIWQRDRVREQGGSVQDLDKAINGLLTLLHGVLGVP